MIDPEDLARRAADVNTVAVSPEDILLTDQVAVVTGGGGGIGHGTALGLARFGAKVAVLDVAPERCRDTEAAIRGQGGEALGLVTDVMQPDELRASIQRAHDHFGRLDILVNNAGGVRAGLFLTQPESSIRRHIEINLVSTVIASQEAARLMVAGGRGGSIVNVSSIEGRRGAPQFAVYAACKAAVINFAKTTALELAEHGIRVNGIAPDHTITPGNRGNRTGPVDPEHWPANSARLDEGWANLIPLGREGLVEECAAAIVWLCSPMARYVTGETISVDGGTWAGGGWFRRREGGWGLTPGLRLLGPPPLRPGGPPRPPAGGR